MLTPLKDCLKDLLTTLECPLCRQELERSPRRGALCMACWQRIDLAAAGVQGQHPCPWTAAGWYDGALRQLILQLRRHPDLRLLHALTDGLGAALSNDAVLVPIPGWKAESRRNPLPTMICRSLQRTTRSLLKRSRPTVGQHHLNRQQRMTNQRGSFVVDAGVQVPRSVQDPQGEALELWLVDDILTSGATARAAMDALNNQGITVRGVICLGRTPLGRTR
ncbi:MAG: ComF family protein [Synechococcus sp.]